MICGKVIYHSQSEAKATLNGVNSDKRPTRSNSQPIIAYFCEDCDGWHVASKAKSKPHKPKHSSQDFTKSVNKRESSFLIIKNYSSRPCC